MNAKSMNRAGQSWDKPGHDGCLTCPGICPDYEGGAKASGLQMFP